MNARRFPGVFLLVSASLAAFSFSATPAGAGTAPWISYAVKFVCGAETDQDVSIVRGKYRTEINIHNPHYLVDGPGLPQPVVFFKKAVLSLPQGEPPLRPTCKQPEALQADYALAVNCVNIKALLSLSGLPTVGDLEGFVVIEVPPQGLNQFAPPLDVVAVYTARPQTGNEHPFNYHVRTMDVERYKPTDVIGTPDSDPCVVE